MADALISVLLEKLGSIAYEKIEKEVRLVKDVKKEVVKVTSNLIGIKAVLEDAEKKEVTEATVRHWLEKLEDVSYEMDDVLDSWNTEILIQVAKQEKDQDENVLVITKKKVCFSIPSHCFCFGQVSRMILRRNIALEIKDLNDRLNEIAKERETFKFEHTETRIEPPQQHKTSVSFVDITFGREDESKKIVDLLLSESSEEERGPLVIPIVGMGGMGKTTLAQLAYNDHHVQAHFEKRVWVCVSNPFDESKVAKAIIDGDGTPNSDELEAVFQCMCKSIEGKKFLIVLDDVWSQWQKLKLPLQKGAKGSRILVTTRKEDVAISMGAKKSHMTRLEQLSEPLCWSLFSHIAFSNWEQEFDVFEPIGKEIVKKCKGLPLVAKTLGSLMNLKITRKEWQDVLDSKIWELKVVEQDVFQPLLLSYDDLESATKRCLLYCAIFPKDYVFEKDNLIELWMSHDYLSFGGNQEKKTVGENHFNDLVRRSFFQDFKKDGEGNVTVKMHDIVHEFLQFLTKKECFSIDVKDSTKRIKLPGYKVRHLTLMLTFKNPYGSGVSLLPPVSSDNWKSIRTLTASGSRISNLDPDFILQLKGLRTLNLSDNLIEEVPEEIGGLVHLRYVDLSNNFWLKKLPESMCNLYNLQTLRLDWCRHLEKLPKAIGKLINLNHLHVEHCDKLKYLPKGVERLTSLRVLDGFSVSDVDENETLKLGDLRLLDKLQGSLSIYQLGNVTDVSEAKKARLENKMHILRLELGFWNGDMHWEGQSDVEILNVLQPPRSVERLSITCYNGTIGSPKWIISLQNLTTLHLDNWRNCEFLPPLGKLPSLETLTIEDMVSVKKVGVEFLGIEETQSLSKKTSSSPSILFPKLKLLRFKGMSEWKEWEGAGGWMEEEDSHISIMPCLSALEIWMAGCLRTLPDFLGKISTLHDLSIFGCPYILVRGCRKGGKERPKISHIPNIEIYLQKVREGGVWIQEYESDKSDSVEGHDDIVQESFV